MKNSHHANLVVGTSSNAERFVRDRLKSEEVEVVNNPDFVVLRGKTFGIDEARELKELSTRKALGVEKIFLILPETITREAQNALLKLFEDPAPQTKFFLAAKEQYLIIPTLLSRMNVILVSGEEDFVRAQDFLSLPLRKRLIFASDFAENKADLNDFVGNLVSCLKKERKEDTLRKTYNIYRLLGNQNTGARVILEHLSLVL